MTIHPIYKVVQFRNVAPYTLKIKFNDNQVQTIDFEPVLFGEMYGPLKDIELFNQVKIDHESNTLVWPNDADFEPATLHDWDEYADEFAERAKNWAKQEVQQHT
jgi:hypothetical protein